MQYYQNIPELIVYWTEMNNHINQKRIPVMFVILFHFNCNISIVLESCHFHCTDNDLNSQQQFLLVILGENATLFLSTLQVTFLYCIVPFAPEIECSYSIISVFFLIYIIAWYQILFPSLHNLINLNIIHNNSRKCMFRFLFRIII